MKEQYEQIDLKTEQKRIGLRFRQLRMELGYTSHETFSYDYELDRSQYGKIEAGSSNLTLKIFVRHLKAFKMTFTEFFNDEYEKIGKEDKVKK